MTGDARLPELFAELSEMPEEERQRHLARLEAEQPALANEVRQLLASRADGARRLSGNAWQTLYHFAVGGAVDDARLRTLDPYAHR